MSERELFEHNFPKPEDIYWCKDSNDYNYIDKGRGNPYAYDNLISYRLAWKAWQASAKRQGYKLVPVEPTQLMYRSFCDGRDDVEAPNAAARFKNGYKAMIGSVE